MQLANPMALALTGSRLLVLSISPPVAMGKGGDVKERASFKLEAGAGADARGLSEEFEHARRNV